MDKRGELWSPRRDARSGPSSSSPQLQGLDDDPLWRTTPGQRSFVRDFTSEVSSRLVSSDGGRPSSQSQRTARTQQSPARSSPAGSSTKPKVVRLRYEASPERPRTLSSSQGRLKLEQTSPQRADRRDNLTERSTATTATLGQIPSHHLSREGADGLMFLSKRNEHRNRTTLQPLSPPRVDLRNSAPVSVLDHNGSRAHTSAAKGTRLSVEERALTLVNPAGKLKLSPERLMADSFRSGPEHANTISPSRRFSDFTTSSANNRHPSPEHSSGSRASRWSPNRVARLPSNNLNKNEPLTERFDPRIQFEDQDPSHRPASNFLESVRDDVLLHTSPNKKVVTRPLVTRPPTSGSGKTISPKRQGETEMWDNPDRTGSKSRSSAFRPSPFRPTSADRRLSFDDSVPPASASSPHETSPDVDQKIGETVPRVGSNLAGSRSSSSRVVNHDAASAKTESYDDAHKTPLASPKQYASSSMDFAQFHSAAKGNTSPHRSRRDHPDNFDEEKGTGSSPNDKSAEVLFAPASDSKKVITAGIVKDDGRSENAPETDTIETRRWLRIADLLDMSGFDGTEIRKYASVQQNHAQQDQGLTVETAIERALGSILRDFDRQKKLIERSMEATKREDQYRAQVQRELAEKDEKIQQLEARLLKKEAASPPVESRAPPSNVPLQSIQVLEQRVKRWETRSRRFEDELHRTRDQLEQEIQLALETRKKAREEFERLLGRKAASGADSRIVSILEGFVQEQLRGLKSQIAPSNLLPLTTQDDEDSRAVRTARTRDELTDFVKRICELVVSHSSSQDKQETLDVMGQDGDGDQEDWVDATGLFPTRMLAQVIPQISRWIAKGEEVDHLRFWRDQVIKELGTKSEDEALRALRRRRPSMREDGLS